jgi:glycosyltransferase involved in cell wall biosynthesis
MAGRTAHDLVVFAEDWGGHPSSSQHLVRHLAHSRRVLWTNSIGLRRPRPGDLGRAAAKLSRFARGARGERSRDGARYESTPAFEVLAPLTLPAPRSRLARAAAAAVLRRQIAGAQRAAGIDEHIAWVSLPTAVDVLPLSGTRAVVYYCGDDFGALAGVDHDTVLAREAELVARADLIVAASEALASRFPADRTRCLPHGVDFARFSTPAPRSGLLPDAAVPVAGFYGTIADWLDIALISGAARALPDWQFVLVGEVRTDVGDLARLGNVRWTGPLPHRDLPALSQHWTASLLPFHRDAQIAACNPLKLREYLAAGRPVVSTRFPAVEEYADVVHLIDDVPGLVAALEAARDERCGDERQRRVAGEDWHQRAQQLDRWLGAL